MQALIGRIWRGRVKRQRLEEYLAYNRAEELDEIAREGAVATGIPERVALVDVHVNSWR